MTHHEQFIEHGLVSFEYLQKMVVMVEVLGGGKVGTVGDKIVRAGGDVVCAKCGKKYLDHPSSLKYLDWHGYPYLNVLCDGTLVKL